MPLTTRAFTRSGNKGPARTCVVRRISLVDFAQAALSLNP